MLKDETRRPRSGSCFAVVALLSLIAAAGCSSPPEPPKPPQRKNVLLITLDGLRQDHLSAFGYTRQTSPSIDWLVLNGIAFRTVVPAGCSTRASLTSLLTARPYAHSQLENGTALKEGNDTLAEAFQRAGYSTAAFVGSPLLAAETSFGQGFQTYDDFGETADTFVGAEVPVGAAIKHLQARAADAPPFFLYLQLQEPHPPWKHGSPWLKGEEPMDSFFKESCAYIPSADEMALIGPQQKEHLVAKYDGALRFADEQIGALTAHLRSTGLLANTIIALTTTHGIELLERFSAGHAYNPYDEVLRTFVVFFDQSRSFKEAIPDAVQPRMFDIGATLTAMAGVEKPADSPGIDLLGAPGSVPDFAFAHCDVADVVRSLEYKLIAFDLSVLRALGKPVPPQLTDGTKLYALRSDPREQIDASESNPEQLALMQSALDGFRAALGRKPATVAAELKPRTRERLRALGCESE
jgi:arylsulfatase A-like enzyme